MALIKGISGPSAGRSRAVRLRSGGAALASAWRTMRRCTPSLRATPFTLPMPNSYSLRICSNSSTFALLSIPSLLPHQQDAPVCRGGPFFSIEVGHFTVSKSGVEPAPTLLGRHRHLSRSAGIQARLSKRAIDRELKRLRDAVANHPALTFV